MSDERGGGSYGNPAVRDSAPSATERGLVVRVAGSVTVDPLTPPASATRTSVAQNAADVLLLAANAARKQAVFTNESGVELLLAYGAVAASATNYTLRIPPNESRELPSSNYTGEIRGIWTFAGGGACRITELS